MTRQVSRRAVLGGSLGGLVAPAMPDAVRCDVVVIGAGLAGLTAAGDLVASGVDVVVLEARSRIGGRTLDVRTGSGDLIEMGGQWIAGGQRHINELVRRFGLQTYDTPPGRQAVYFRDGKAEHYGGDTPPAGFLGLLDAQRTIGRLDDLAADVVPAAPWQTKDATTLDARSVAEFLGSTCFTDEGRELLQLSVQGVYGEDAAQVSLLDLLAAIAGVGGKFETLIGSAQDTRIVGGPQQICARLAAALGDRVRLGQVVTAVEAGPGTVTVRCGDRAYPAKAVIVTVPKPVIPGIRFEPALPANLTQLLQRQPTGSTIKVNVVYDRPFWRDDDLSGEVISDRGPVRLVFDNSPASGRAGVLVGFFEGRDARAYAESTMDERRRVTLECLQAYFGVRAATPIEYHELVWAGERYTGGAYGSFNPPGVLTGVMPFVRMPDDRIVFAGADFATAWPGYMDGAVSSGRQAAQRILVTFPG